MSDQSRFAGTRRALLLFCSAVALSCVIPAAAGAATITPTSFTSCGGTVSHDRGGSAVGEPNLLDYKFRCDGNISAYTVIVDQDGDPNGSVDDFNSAPSVLSADGFTPSSTGTLACEGTLPSDGINCNAGGSVLAQGNFAAGSIDPVQAYCKHLPTKARPGTPAVPKARVQLVVTDSTGAQDGPFNLRSTIACKKVPNVAPTAKAKRKHNVRRAIKYADHVR